jgi:hypothetical protein
MWTLIGLMLAFFATSALLRLYVGREWGPLMQMPWWVLGPVIAAIQRRPKIETLPVQATAEGIRFAAKLVPRAKLSAILRQEGDRTFVLLRGKGMFAASADVEVKGDAEADRLCGALGLDAKSATAEFAMQRTRNIGRPVLLVTVGAIIASVVALQFHSFIAPLVVFGALFAALVVSIPVATVAQRIKLRVGADGIVVQEGFAKRRFISHNEIRSVDSMNEAVLVGLANGEQLRFEVGARTKNSKQSAELDTQARSIAWRIEKALQAYRALAGEAPQAALALDRGEKTVPEWIDQLRRVGHGASATFRDVGLTREQLLRVVESTTAAAKERLAAVVALREGLTEEEKPRIRVAADRCVEPAMRERMVRVAFAPDEELIETLGEENVALRR